MKPGLLLQYKENCFGWYYPKLPKEVFAAHHLLPSVHQNVFGVYDAIKAGKVVDTSRKKYVLISAETITLSRVDLPSVKCDYTKCFISDPYMNNETIDGWIRKEWVEPLNENITYKEDNLEHIRFLLMKNKKNTRK